LISLKGKNNKENKENIQISSNTPSKILDKIANYRYNMKCCIVISINFTSKTEDIFKNILKK